MKANWYLLIGLLSLLVVHSGMAQTPARSIPDSLLRYLRTARQDTTYIRVANEYAWWLINPIDDLDQADSLLNRMETLAKRLNDPMSLQRVYWSQGRVCERRPEAKHIKQALYYFEKAHQTVIKAHLPPGELQRVLAALGQMHYYNNQYETALKYYLAAMRLTEHYKLKDHVTRAYVGAGEVMEVQGNTQMANQYYQKAYAIAFTDTDKQMLLWATEKKIFQHMGQGQYKQAQVHLRKALIYANNYGNKNWKISLWNSIAQCYIHTGQLGRALHFLKLAERSAITYNPHSELLTRFSLGEYFVARRNYRLAKIQYTKAVKLAGELKESIRERDAAKSLAQLYAQSHDYNNAYTYQVKLSQLNDSLFSNQTTLRIRNLATKYEIEKREGQIKLLNQQKQSAQFQRNAYLIGGVFLLILILLLAAWLLNRARLRRLQEAQSLRQQIAHDLHDEVGSTLSSISLLSGMTDKLLTENSLPTDESASAQRMVKKIYSDTRQILESVDEIIWTINPGNDSLYRIALRLQEYAQPLMESKQIEFNFSVDPALDQLPVSMEVRRNLFLIGKEAINNLVKYSAATVATVCFERRDSQLQVLIEDNGRGFDASQVSQRTGQASMQQRANAMGGELVVESAPGRGTRLQLLVN